MSDFARWLRGNRHRGALVYSSQAELDGDAPLVFDVEEYDTDNLHDVVLDRSESHQRSRFLIPSWVRFAKLEARVVVRHTRDVRPHIGFRKNGEFFASGVGMGAWPLELIEQPLAQNPVSIFISSPWVPVSHVDSFDLVINDDLDTPGYVKGGENGTWFSIQVR